MDSQEERCYICKRSNKEIEAYFAGNVRLADAMGARCKNIADLEAEQVTLEQKFIKNYCDFFHHSQALMDAVPKQADVMSFGDLRPPVGVPGWTSPLEKVMPGIQGVNKLPPSLLHIVTRGDGTIGTARACIVGYARSLASGKVTSDMISCIPRADGDNTPPEEERDARQLHSVREELSRFQEVDAPFGQSLVRHSFKKHFNRYGTEVGLSSSRQKGDTAILFEIKLCPVCALLFR